MKIHRSAFTVLLIAGTALAAFGQIITVTSPAGGVRWELGTPVTITWTATGVSGNVRINLIDGSDGVAGQISASVAATAGRQSWNVGELLSGDRAAAGENFRIRIRAIEGETRGESALFAITAATPRPQPELTLTAPNGGQVWCLGETQNITWSSRNLLGVEWVRVSLYKGGRDDAHFEGTISASYAIGSGGAGSMPWNAGAYIGGTAAVGNSCYYIKVSTLDNSLADFSNAPFTIGQSFHLLEPMQAVTFTPPSAAGPSIEVPTPLAPLTLTHPFTINWAARGVSGNLAINLIQDPGDSYPIASGVSPGLATGHYTWNVGQLATGGSYFHAVEGERFRFQITGRGVVGLSRWFEIRRPSLAVTEPHSGQRLRRGDRTTIRWSAPDLRGDVKIEAQSRVLPGGFYRTYATLSAAAPNLGRRDWTIWPRPRAGSADIDPPPSGDNVRWRIFLTSVRNPQIVAASDDFIIE